MQSKNKTISDEEFINVCKSSKSMREACLTLGLAFTTFKKRAIKLGCYIPNQGLKGETRKKITKISTDDILAGKYPKYNTYKLKLRLINEGYKEDECEVCGWSEKPEGAKYTPCELHHIDGNPHNHCKDNLVILCPNCHALTKNYRFRKRVPGEKSSE